MSTEIECYLCGIEFTMSDSIRFIKFDKTTKMFHNRCREVIDQLIEAKKKEYEASNPKGRI